MRGFASVVGRFSAQEFAVRRAYAADPEFREICDHFADAVSALAHWSGDKGKADDYRQIVCELEEEIAQYLATRYSP